ncbi:MAG: AAA family ATPase, partial [Clostridiales bacterium]|nr:AAA family ATPase [Clostridiales bacterium]
MIQTLHIRNIALIDELEISLSQGFHILTGETGAGKSIIIDAVNFVLGERANRDLIQSGAESAAVEASFSTLSSPSVQQKLNEFGIPYEAGDELVFSRALYTNGKNVIRINGVLVNLGTLKSISDMLVDIHGQHDHQSLLRQDEHISFLDHFGKASISEKKRQVSELYQA